MQDLGADKIRKFNLIKKKNKDTLQNQKEINVKLGSGPRHFTFHPNGKFGFGINELSGKIDLYSYKNGNLDFIEEYLSFIEQQIYIFLLMVIFYTLLIEVQKRIVSLFFL